MAATKYGQHIKTLAFQDQGMNPLRQAAVMDGKYLGIDKRRGN
jgi:hypothetical protein